jgi:hypothetical protein
MSILNLNPRILNLSIWIRNGSLSIVRLKETSNNVTAKPKHIFYNSLLVIIMGKLYNVTKHICDSLH